MSAPFEELVVPLDDAALLCRACLAESGEMKDMAEWGLAEDFSNFSGVQVDSSQGLSQLLCTACEDLLVKCKMFRTQCWNSDAVIRDMAKRKAEKQKELENETINEDLEDKPEPEITLSCVLYDSQLVVMISAPDPEAKVYLSCPYNECIHKFVKKRDLMNHLVNIHNINGDTFIIDLQYYCSHSTCKYHVNSRANKWFSGRKFLNQHYNKVHKFKSLRCETCSMKFSTETAFNRHKKECNMTFTCTACNVSYDTNEKLIVHLMRRHPEAHQQYKDERKASKRKFKTDTDPKKSKVEDYICDSPKRSFATQTLKPEENIKNDVNFSTWSKSDYKTDEISTQTVFEDLLSLKSQNSEDESLFFSESVSLSDIQTQTFSVEFGLSRSNKETITSETQSPDLSIKETQTCFCLYDPPRLKNYDSVASSPASIHLTSAQTQTSEKATKSDAWLSFNTTETQTCFDDL